MVLPFRLKEADAIETAVAYAQPLDDDAAPQADHGLPVVSDQISALTEAQLLQAQGKNGVALHALLVALQTDIALRPLEAKKLIRMAYGANQEIKTLLQGVVGSTARAGW